MSEDLRPTATRVFDTDHQQYLDSDEYMIDGYGQLWIITDSDSIEDMMALQLVKGSARYLVERWTGRQDQNGQAVYKGHIVKTPNDTGVVDWDDTYLTWVIDYTYGGLADPRWPREVLCDCADVDLLIVGTTHDAKGGEG